MTTNFNPCQEKDCEDKLICREPISTSCLFYRLENQENSKLYTIEAENGTPLNQILEDFDSLLNKQLGINTEQFQIPYLSSIATIKNIKDFAEVVSMYLGNIDGKVKGLEQCCVDSKNTNDNILLDLNKIKFPKITDTSIAGFTPESDIWTVLQKLSNRLSTFINGNTNNNNISPNIQVLDTKSVKLNSGGSQGHTISANLVTSPDTGNIIEIRNNGVYVGTISATNQLQTLSLINRLLSINGGNTVTLPIQTLSLNGTNLTLSDNGGTINLSNLVNNTPLTTNDSSTIDFNNSGVNGHTLTGDVKISSKLGNQLENDGGLYVKDNLPCFSFRIENTGTNPGTIQYIDCNNDTVSVVIPSGSGASGNGVKYINNVRQIPIIVANGYLVTCLGWG